MTGRTPLQIVYHRSESGAGRTYTFAMSTSQPPDKPLTEDEHTKLPPFEMVDEQMAAIYRAMTPAQRVAIMFDANETMRKLLRGRIMTDHPEWDTDQVNAEVARRMLDDAR